MCDSNELEMDIGYFMNKDSDSEQPTIYISDTSMEVVFLKIYLITIYFQTTNY